jgi:hypothetical protein
LGGGRVENGRDPRQRKHCDEKFHARENHFVVLKGTEGKDSVFNQFDARETPFKLNFEVGGVPGARLS